MRDSDLKLRTKEYALGILERIKAEIQQPWRTAISRSERKTMLFQLSGSHRASIVRLDHGSFLWSRSRATITALYISLVRSGPYRQNAGNFQFHPLSLCLYPLNRGGSYLRRGDHGSRTRSRWFPESETRARRFAHSRFQL